MTWATTLPRSVIATKAQVVRQLRSRCDAHIVDHSNAEAADVAVYTLSDPRDLRLVRYVGQTTLPRRRYLQHVGAAKIWLPDELPWWIKSPTKRPLYEWIRDLYRDECRLPVMAVVAWTQRQHALAEERRHILELLGHQLPLLNRESACQGQMLAPGLYDTSGANKLSESSSFADICVVDRFRRE
jgi:hypothetical protein